MSFLRPAAVSALSRWAETIAVTLGTVVFTILTIRSSGAILPFVFGALTLICAVSLIVAIRRARIKGGQGVNSGYVQVDERQISYFHLGQSWSVSINDLTSVVIDTADGVHWVIRDQFGSIVRIPNNAGGNDAVFDAVSALSGVSFDQISAAMGSTGPAIFTIWRKR